MQLSMALPSNWKNIFSEGTLNWRQTGAGWHPPIFIFPFSWPSDKQYSEKKPQAVL
jgi:hypothetical protein